MEKRAGEPTRMKKRGSANRPSGTCSHSRQKHEGKGPETGSGKPDPKRGSIGLTRQRDSISVTRKWAGANSGCSDRFRSVSRGLGGRRGPESFGPESFGAAARGPRPGQRNLRFGSGGKNGFQPAAFGFHLRILFGFDLGANLPPLWGKDWAAKRQAEIISMTETILLSTHLDQHSLQILNKTRPGRAGSVKIMASLRQIRPKPRPKAGSPR